MTANGSNHVVLVPSATNNTVFRLHHVRWLPRSGASHRLPRPSAQSKTRFQSKWVTGILFLATAPLLGVEAPAQGIQGHDCQACHLTPRSAMTISGHQSTADFGFGAFKVFRVEPGQTSQISINVSDGRDRYAIGITHPFPGGTGDTNRHLAYQPDPTWKDHSTFYATQTTNVNQRWTYNLSILSNTPPDFYLLTIQTAGITNVASGPVDEWNHLEQVFVQVTPTSQAIAWMESPHVDGGIFSVRVPTTNGLSYTLEYRLFLSAAPWVTVSQVPGNGSMVTLSDTNTHDAQRFYRIRTE